MRVNSSAVRIWMLRRTCTVAQISRDLGIHRSAVSRTISDEKRLRRVVAWFLRRGCPARHFGLSRDEATELLRIVEAREAA